MLRHLSVNNYALISRLDIDFQPGLTIITGETGAGKSILLGALGLLLGQRADAAALSDKSKKCVVEGHFEVKDFSLQPLFQQHDLDYAATTIIRREVNPEGKSRAFINDTPVNLTVLRAITEKLVDIHSQHETLTLNDSDFQLSLIDSLAGHQDALNEYRSRFVQYKKLSRSLDELREKEAASRRELEFNRFQFDELDKARLQPGEQTSAEEELQTLENSETIKSGLHKAVYTLDGAEQSLLQALTDVRNTVGQLARFNPAIAALHERINVSHIELKDIAAELESLEGSVQHDPARIAHLSERLDIIYRLGQKHGVKTVEELLAIQHNLDSKIAAAGTLEEQINAAAAELAALHTKLQLQAAQLSKKRLAVAPKLVKAVQEMLRELGMPNATLEVSLTQEPTLRESGTDKANFLFSANKGMATQPLSKVASGGELSRLMLSLKALLAKHTALPTIIFDEIDTGISGDIAARTGLIMEQMGKNLQVIAITHLPQVASRGKNHLFVYKQETKHRTETAIRSLQPDERIQEIAKMLSTGKPGEAALKNAKELLGA
ncbi:MAG: DNA repair protein RecN [Bacteroidia bacterium]|jgi:DNA repair protein RecN (Recombination protein N)|nr:DNA repair protein RecN [Bacteroidia bacterium]